MSIEDFYAQLLKDTSVDAETMEAAREKRDELGKKVVRVLAARDLPARWIPAGALAQRTQIAPLNDVDGVVEIAVVSLDWARDPRLAQETVRRWLEPVIEGTFTLSPHAIQIMFPDEDFTADVVVARKREKKQGLLITHCPQDEPAEHDWIVSDPETHAKQVRKRNEDFGSAIFTRQVRILKHFNRMAKMHDPQERKPVASFHMTALALYLLTEPDTHAQWTPYFFERAAQLVLRPLPDPAGVGDPLEADDPAYASVLFAEAARKTRAALTASPTKAEALLRDVFPDPKRLDAIVRPASVAIGRGGALGVPTAEAVRHSRPVRSHGGPDR